MIYNPAGSNNASLLTLVQGTISFVAGATAKSGDMKVETPTATMGIRGTAVLVEIDFDVAQPGARAAGVVPDSGRAEWHDGRIRPARQGDAAADRDGEPAGHANHRQRPGRRHLHRVGPDSGQCAAAHQRDLLAQIHRRQSEIHRHSSARFDHAADVRGQAAGRHADRPASDHSHRLHRLEAPSGPPPSGGNTRFHLNIPPDLLVSGNQFYRTASDDRQYRAGHGVRHAFISPTSIPKTFRR